jgi:hypothetical protein
MLHESALDTTKVETMTEPAAEPEDTQGHAHRAFATEDTATPDANDTEGHSFHGADTVTTDEEEEDDTEGHARRA